MIKPNFELIQDFTKTKGLYARVLHDKTSKTVIEHWDDSHGTDENFRKVLTCVIDTVKNLQCKRWLVDLRGMQGGFGKNMEWLTNVAIPQIKKNGVIKQAIIVPKEIYASLSLKDASQKVDILVREAFVDENAAYEWLIK